MISNPARPTHRPGGGVIEQSPTNPLKRRYNPDMKRALAILVAIATLSITGCTGRYTMDMSGLDRASQDHVEPTSDHYTMSELDRASDSALDEASRKYSLSTLNDLSSKTFDPYTRGRK